MGRPGFIPQSQIKGIKTTNEVIKWKKFASRTDKGRISLGKLTVFMSAGLPVIDSTPVAREAVRYCQGSRPQTKKPGNYPL